MDDQPVLTRIQHLVEEERALRARHEDGLEGEERRRMQALEVELDQCWDYLRQRRAARDYGLAEEQATVRPPGLVENYEQ